MLEGQYARGEQERLRAENERFREALTKIQRFRWPDELKGWTTFNFERLDWCSEVAHQALTHDSRKEVSDEA